MDKFVDVTEVFGSLIILTHDISAEIVVGDTVFIRIFSIHDKADVGGVVTTCPVGHRLCVVLKCVGAALLESVSLYISCCHGVEAGIV